MHDLLYDSPVFVFQLPHPLPFVATQKTHSVAAPTVDEVVSSPRNISAPLVGHLPDTPAYVLAKTARDRPGAVEQLPEGFLGKLQLLKSGKVKLVVGELSFAVRPPVAMRKPK